jgi:tetratricopeptide (TPR) repeat protein
MFPLAVLICVFLQVANPVAPLLQRAKQDFEAGRYAEARTELQQALKLAPADPALWSNLGLAEHKLDNPEAAIADLDKARALDPRNAQNYFNLGMLYHQRGETAKALEDYRHGLLLAPDDRAANESYARLLMETRQYREAIAPLEKLKRNSPSNFSFRVALIESYLKAGMNDQGGVEIQQFVKAPNCSTRDQLDLAKLLVEMKKADAARWVFEQVLQAAPDLAEAHAGLGMVWMDMGRYKDAAQELGRAAQLSPDSVEYFQRYTEALLLSKQYPAALDYLKSVKDRFGKLTEYRYQLGLAYYGAPDYPAAIDQLEALVRDYPNLDRAHYFLGHSYSATGDLKNAEVHYRKALALNPQDAYYYAALGHVLRRDNDLRTDEAIGYLEKALKLDPSDTLSKQDLALCYEKKGKYPEAERLMQEVVRNQPGSVSAHRMLARVYYRQGKKEQGDRESASAAKLEAEQLGRRTQMNDTPHVQSPQ